VTQAHSNEIGKDLSRLPRVTSRSGSGCSQTSDMTFVDCLTRTQISKLLRGPWAGEEKATLHHPNFAQEIDMLKLRHDLYELLIDCLKVYHQETKRSLWVRLLEQAPTLDGVRVFKIRECRSGALVQQDCGRFLRGWGGLLRRRVNLKKLSKKGIQLRTRRRESQDLLEKPPDWATAQLGSKSSRGKWNLPTKRKKRRRLTPSALGRTGKSKPPSSTQLRRH